MHSHFPHYLAKHLGTRDHDDDDDRIVVGGARVNLRLVPEFKREAHLAMGTWNIITSADCSNLVNNTEALL